MFNYCTLFAQWLLVDIGSTLIGNYLLTRANLVDFSFIFTLCILYCIYLCTVFTDYRFKVEINPSSIQVNVFGLYREVKAHFKRVK